MGSLALGVAPWPAELVGPGWVSQDVPRKNSVFGGVMTLGVAFGVGHGHDAAAMLLPKAVAVGSAASIAASIRDCESISWSQHSQRGWLSLLVRSLAAGSACCAPPDKCVRKPGGEEGRDPSTFTLLCL